MGRKYLHLLNDWVTLYKEGNSGLKIAKKYNVDPSTVYDYLKEKVNIRSLSESAKKYKIDDAVFDSIDNEEKSYWLGFLYADGCINKRKYGYSLTLELSHKDYSHIEKFKKFLKTDMVIYERENRKSNSITINSQKVCIDLIKHGVVSKKTFIIRFPDFLREDLTNHFLRGYFDGDGCIYLRKETNRGTFNIASGSYNFLIECQTMLMKNCNLNKTKIAIRNGCNIMEYRGDRQLKRIRGFLYKDAETFLERKMKLFHEIR